MPRKSTLSPAPSVLADRLAEASISIEECAAVCGVPAEAVTGWIENGPDAEARVRLRWLADDHTAALAVERVRSRVTRSMRGEGAEHAGVDVPYGGQGGTTGGRPV